MQETHSLEFIEECIRNPNEDEKCHQLHPHSCNMKALLQFRSGSQGVYKMYLLVHIIPLLLKRKQLK